MRRRQAKIGRKIILMDISKPMGTGLETATDMGQEKTESLFEENGCLTDVLDENRPKLRFIPFSFGLLNAPGR